MDSADNFSNQSLKGLIMELEALKVLSCKNQGDLAYNQALTKAVKLIERYRNKEGLFQQ